MRHRRALLPAFAVATVFLAAACSSSAPHAEPSATAGHGRHVEVADRPADGTDHSLAVAAAPATTATATAGPAGSGQRARRTALAVSAYDSHTRRAVLSDKPARQGSSSASPTTSPPPPPPPHPPPPAPRIAPPSAM
ncbi:hypothetical protein [Streptomyces roseochromogenus]|uniref:Uncharacterized protein n=1 Tax=Streptomyces roseochromogenus subsp. oscitans DS 12.976 TaxID=1352936 RepID=V6KQB9_STRRC|nr:hypothetical protein [Streptomyces roseochromogenus]EST34292.1 hypothetical protein M878_11085 [Streptomyces roseochromogenus subsp. oscitans DS 12.976]